MTDPSASPLEAHLGYWLRFVSNHVSQAFAALLAERGVSVAEWVMMRELLDVEAMAPSALAERIGMTRGAVTKIVDRLAARALVERRAGGPDRRTQALALTDRGRALVPELAALADANDAAFFGDLAVWERTALEHVLKAIVRRRKLRVMPVE